MFHYWNEPAIGLKTLVWSNAFAILDVVFMRKTVSFAAIIARVLKLKVCL